MRSRCRHISAIGKLGLLAVAMALPQTVARAEKSNEPLFETQVAPILAEHCQKCHAARDPKGKLDLTSLAGILSGGETGPAIVRGKPSESLLLNLIAKGDMPPEKEKKLTPDEIFVIRRWIDAGAPAKQQPIPPAEPALVSDAARRHWAFVRLSNPAVPTVKHADRVRTPIDQFVLAKLERQGLSLSNDASRETLLRRATFDLVGLPPTPDEIEAFVADTQPDAYERLIDRLLESPHFGERWGRHWLDAAGYVDVMGTDNDSAILNMAGGKWRYRDYVIRSFNQDKQLDRFLLEQIAGDELVDWRAAQEMVPETFDRLVATGFLRSASDDTDAPELRTPDIIHGVLQRTSEVLGSNLLALTVACAKCHNHKYEPISQRDYYRQMAIFAPALNPDHWLPPKDRALPDVSPHEKARIDAHNAEIDRQVEQIEAKLAVIRQPYEDRLFETKLLTLPEPIRADTKRAIQTAGDQRDDVQRYLAARFQGMLKVKASEITVALSEEDKRKSADVDREIAAANQKRLTYGTIQALYDTGAPSPTHLLRRGNADTPGEEVEPGFFAVLCDPKTTSLTNPAKPAGSSSGRRLALAHWLTAWDTPAGALVARVQVNRAWQHLFGKGIVETVDNFGVSGAAPTHPELLEWLASQYIRQGGQLKPLLKHIMMSSVYRQASTTDGSTADAAAADPANGLLGHMRLRRLESEAVRDSILAVSGKLDLALYGPPLPLANRADGSVVLKEPGDAHENDDLLMGVKPNEVAKPSADGTSRRSIYVLARRNYHLSMLNVFDQPVMATNCPCRSTSAVVLQSLTLLNDAFVLQAADAFAECVARRGGASRDSQIESAFLIALARKPTATEIGWSRTLLDRHAQEYQATMPAAAAAQKALAHLCHMLLNTNEFLYVQ